MSKVGYDHDNRFFNDTAGYRVTSGISAVLGGYPALPVARRRLMACPTCGARPRERCQIKIGGKVPGNPVGEAYYRPMKGLHEERGRDAGVSQ